MADSGMPLDWSRLQAFLAICETGSVARAAARLAVQRAAVIRRLDGLEDALCIKLFERQPTAYVLTEAGETLRRDLAGLGAQIDTACTSVQGADQQLDGTIRLSTTDTLLQGLLMPHLRDFCDAHPGIQLQIVMQEAFVPILHRDADLAIRATNHPPEHVVGRHVGDLLSRPHASIDYLHGKQEHAPEALDWIATDESHASLEQARWYRKHVPDERIVLRMRSLVGMVDAAVQGIGVALLPQALAQRHASLVPVGDAALALQAQVWILSHPDLRHVARVRTFAEAMDAALRTDARLRHREAP